MNDHRDRESWHMTTADHFAVWSVELSLPDSGYRVWWCEMELRAREVGNSE